MESPGAYLGALSWRMCSFGTILSHLDGFSLGGEERSFHDAVGVTKKGPNN